ncbi:MAG: tRNA pseudouridine(38-40) synthase TruA [Cyanobacteria bacterium TGS_CYA1]|nr:tRNA pseudouridine(38-40) synthase TruA [Cyanobacteria bacterium TGS_CYA1]
MPRIALLIEYNGKAYHGSQTQKGVITVQQDLESALATLAKKRLPVILAGRTDSGVHARGQVAHFDWPIELELDFERFESSLNGITGKGMSIVKAQVVPDKFSARREALSREYVYRILNRKHASALMCDTHFLVRQPLDVEAMTGAASELLGRHDFSAFRSTSSSAREKSSPVCRVSRSQILNKGEGELEFWIRADHFVYNMVRIIVGTLVEIGLHKRSIESIACALEKLDRNLSGPTAPPWGLTLHRVTYPDEYNLFKDEN